MILKFYIITPDRIFLSDQAMEMVLSTNTGQMGVLVGHAPLITALDIGVFLYRRSLKWKTLALMGGFALIQKNKIIILVNEAADSKTVDFQEAQQTYELAKKQYSQATNSKEKVSANFFLKRAQARFNIFKT